MTVTANQVLRPKAPQIERIAGNRAKVVIEPLERGYGYTLGNSLRRMLLSSLRGAAVWAFRLDGVVHEHQTIPGVVEDVHQIIQRLKQLTLVLAPDADEAVLHIKRDSAGPVYARDIEAHGAVTVANLLPNSALLTLHAWGHTSLFLSACADQAITRYLVDGQTPAPGTVCQQDVVPFAQ